MCIIRNKLLKIGGIKICGRLSLKRLEWYNLLKQTVSLKTFQRLSILIQLSEMLGAGGIKSVIEGDGFGIWGLAMKSDLKKSLIVWIALKVSRCDVFSGLYFPIRTECGDLLRKFLYSVRENTDQKILCIWTLFTYCIIVLNFNGIINKLETAETVT